MKLSVGEIALAVGVYGAIVGAIGLVCARRSSSSPDEYFLAGRRLGTLVLFMALFGTNCTSFVLVGIPGLSYQLGVGVFGLNAAIVALGVPLTFWAIGDPARRWSKELGALTPCELYARRLGSPAVGALLFVAFTLYTVPYMVQGVKAASLVLAEASAGALSPAWVGLGVLVTVLAYTSVGGMRGTAWTNVFQGTLFLGFMLAAVVLMARSLGGWSQATQNVRSVDPALLVRGEGGLFAPRAWASWGLVISTTVIGFPHMIVRLMAAGGAESLKSVCRLYPLALVLLWVPAVAIGVWGRGAFPELERPDLVFSTMAGAHLPQALGVLAFLAVLAAVMSTLDAQILTLSSMLVRDVLRPLVGTQVDQVRVGRWFTFAIAALVYGLSLSWGDSVFAISRKAFEGYTTLVPTLFLGVRWSGFTARGALASILAGNLVLSWAGRGRAFQAWASSRSSGPS